MAIAREEAGRVTMPDTSTGAIPGDYVVPQYSEEGRKILRGAVVGGAEAQTYLAQKIARSMAKHGELMPTIMQQPAVIPKAAAKKSKAKKIKVATEVPTQSAVVVKSDAAMYDPEASLPVASPILVPGPYTSTPKKSVDLLLDFGKIKVIVDAILEIENGIALVFASEDDISFIPDQGSELKISIENQKIPVMYLGLLFKWYSTSQIIMTFIKTK